MRKSDEVSGQPSFLTYLGLGLNIAITILIFVMIGYFVDRKFSMLPVFTIIGSAAGFLAGLLTLYKTIRQFSNGKLPEQEKGESF